MTFRHRRDLEREAAAVARQAEWRAEAERGRAERTARDEAVRTAVAQRRRREAATNEQRLAEARDRVTSAQVKIHLNYLLS